MPKTMPEQKPGRSTQDVCTPKGFLRAVKHLLGIEAFAIDLAASPTNTVAKRFFSERSDALRQPSWVFDGWDWMNPPYADIKPWARKAWEQSRRGAQIAMLIPAAVGSNWWRDWVHTKARILLLNGRIQFVGHTHGYPKDLALLIYRQDIVPAYEVWTWTQPAVPALEGTPPGPLEMNEFYLPPDECRIELYTDTAGAECIAGGVLPGYLKEQARAQLKLAEPKPLDELEEQSA